MPNFTVRSAYRFNDGRTGTIMDVRAFQAEDLDDAKRVVLALIADRPGLGLVSAVVTVEATGAIVWSLQAPMCAESVASFSAGLPPGAGT